MASGKRIGKKSQSSNDFLEPLNVTGLTASDVGTSRPYLATANTTSTASAAGTGAAVNLAWTLPALSPAATSYTITTIPSTYTVTTGTSTPSYTFQGLASNTAYTFLVRPSNAAGTATGTTSSSVTGTTVPATMSAPTPTAGVDSNSVAFTAPANGGKAITAYTVTGSDSTTGTGATSPIAIADTGGTSQTYTVRATNANGTSIASPASGSITTLPPFFPPYFPPYFPPFFPPFFPPYFPPFFPPFFPPYFPPFFPPFFPPYFPPYFPPFFPPYFPAAYIPPFFPPSFGPYFAKPKCCCIGEDTMITTPQGFVMAKDISVGDKLLTVSPDNLVLDDNDMYTFTTENGKVELVETIVTEATRSHEKAIYFNDDMTVIYSINQPLFIKSESGLTSISAYDVTIGSVLVAVSPDGTLDETKVESISDADEMLVVYTIRTGPQRWFIAGGHLVIS